MKVSYMHSSSVNPNVKLHVRWDTILKCKISCESFTFPDGQKKNNKLNESPIAFVSLMDKTECGLYVVNAVPMARSRMLVNRGG